MSDTSSSVPAVEAPVAPATPATPPPAAITTPGSSEPAPYSPADDNAAGLAAFRAARAAAENAPPSGSIADPVADVVAAAVTEAEGAPAADPAPASTPTAPAAPEADPSDAKLNRVFNRIAALERERDEARTHVSRLEQQAARAMELEAQVAKFKSAPIEALKDVGWNQDTLADFILKGEGAVSPQLSAQDAKIAELEKRLAARDAADQAREQERRISEFKSTLPKQLEAERSKLPHLSTYFESDAEMADAVWSVMRTSYQQHRTELTPAEAAQAVETVLSEQAKRFARASSQIPTPPATSAPAAKPTTPTLTNKPPVAAPPPSVADDDVSPNFAAAAQMLRLARKQQ